MPGFPHDSCISKEGSNYKFLHIIKREKYVLDDAKNLCTKYEFNCDIFCWMVEVYVLTNWEPHNGF